jgi:hypothetical protein
LERADGQTKVAAELPDVTGASVERQQVILEYFDRVEACAGDGAQLFIERAAQRDGGDRTFGHAICSGGSASRRTMTPSRCLFGKRIEYLRGGQYRPTTI